MPLLNSINISIKLYFCVIRGQWGAGQKKLIVLKLMR